MAVERAENYQTLINLGVPRDLLDSAIEKGVNQELLVQRLRLPMSKSLYRPLVIKHEWQLLLLGSGVFNYQAQSRDFWAIKDNWGSMPALYLSWSGNPDMLNWVKENIPDLLNGKTYDHSSIAHYAAFSGKPEVLNWVKESRPDLLNEKSTDGRTIAHYAAWSGNHQILQYLFNEHPSLASKLWVPDKNGDMPNAFAPATMTPKPNQILDEMLIEATNRVTNQESKPNGLPLLIAFKDRWQELLIKDERFNVKNLVEKKLEFPPELQDIINPLLTTLQLKAYTFTDGKVTKTQLENLLTIIPPEINKQSKTGLIQSLTTFCKNCREDSFNDRELRCLKIITDDYERGLSGDKSPMFDLIIKKLVTSETLDQFRPKPDNTKELNINPQNFKEHLAAFSTRIKQLPLNNDERRIMNDVMLPGLEKLISCEDAIVEHAVKKFGVLYYLDDNEKLPLHTDHTPVADANAYRETLHRLVLNFFGAADIAHKAARLSEFCSKITQGYCFEGRVRDTFEWVSSFSELLSFDALMQRYIEEYHAYTTVMMGQTDTASAFIEPARDFIMARYKNMPCTQNNVYAPNAELTAAGVEKYLNEMLSYNLKQPILEIDSLIKSLTKETKFFWNQSTKALKNDKIRALTELKKLLEDGRAPAEAIKEIKEQHPNADKGRFSRVKALFNKLAPSEAGTSKTSKGP